ncbi:putative Ig domain-containing protein [uncultured Methanolobus sp.]|uniref:putative Ig domain-containing protein n=1 Tax=uncultured Methanolobus sp. TaxID=218300 RepID=UPI002AAADC54|nr:putative Ig domain-containing protein [uncultured Methanolobus sp.]
MFPKGTEKCKKIGFIFISIALSVLLLSVFASAYSNETVSIGSTVVNPGVSFSLPVFVDNITNIRLLSLDVFFNSPYILIDDMDGNSSSSVSYTQFYLDNSTGFANMTLEFDNLSSEKELSVASLMFRSVTSGYYDIVLRNVSFSNDTISFPADYVVNGSVRVNYPPQIDNIENMTVDVGSNLNFFLSATDQDDTNLSFNVEGIPVGYSLNSSNRSFSWTPTETDAGNHSANFSVTDGYASDFTYATIFVNASEVPIIDNPPELHSIGNKSLNETETLFFVIEATDQDNDSIVYSADNLPGNSTLNESSGEFSWITGYSDSGEYTVEFTASSTNLTDSEIIAIAVVNANRVPVFSEIGEQYVNETETLEISLSATDYDSDDTLSYYTNATFGNLSDNVFTWVPDYNASGTYVTEFTVSDGNDSDSEIVVINVEDANRPPILSPIGNVEVDENDSLSINLSASDLDNNDLTYSSNVTFGNISDNVFTWVPDFDDAGIYAVEFTVDDGVDSDSQIAVITVNNVNRAPVLSGIGPQSVSENNLLEISLSANDEDSEDSLTYSTNASFGNLSGTLFSWTPGSDDSGVYSVEFNVIDGYLVDSEIVIITVSNVNNAPVLSEIGEQFISENDTLIVNLSATDADIDANLTYSTNATFGDFSANTFTWRPDYDSAGIHVVEFTVSDGIDSDSEIVVINVENTNRAPTLNPIADVVVNENTPLSITLSANDPDGNNLTYSSNVTFGNVAGNIFTWTPDYDAAGIYTVEFTASDGPDSDTEVVTITVNNVNRAPSLSPLGSYTVDENSLLTISLDAEDLDSEDTLDYDCNVSFGNLNNNVFTWIPDYEKAGVYVIEFTASDGVAYDSEVAIITVNNINRAPVLSLPESYSAAENSSVVITLSANDPDTGDSLYYSHNATFGNLENNIFTWTPDYDSSGIHATEFTASDGDLSDSDVVVITVSNTNRPPYIDPISDKLVNENEELIIEINGSDPDGDTLNYDKSVDFGTLVNNIFTWTPGFEDSDIYDVTFTVSDGNLSYTESIKIAVGNTNVPPVLDHIGGKTVDENHHLSFTINATDEDSGDTLTYSASGLPSGASFSDQTRQFSWIPTYNQSGTHNLFFEVSDGTFSDSELVEIVVNNVNIAPVLAPIGNITVNEDSEISFIVTATDHDKDSLVYSFSNPSQVGSFNSITHEFRWIPDYEDSGTYNFTFTVSDNDLSDSETIYIEVQNINRAPELDSIGNKAVNEAEELSFTINATDPDLDSLIYSATGIPDGADFDTSTRTFAWTPSYDDSGTYAVTFNVSDGNLSDSETITISVGSVNRPPELVTIGDKTAVEGSEISFTIDATDPDLNYLAYSTSSLPQGAEFDEDTRTFSWTPDYEQSGSHSITFTVSDGSLSDSETIFIDVENTNRAPILSEIGNKIIAEGSELSFTISATDSDHDSLVYSATGIPDGADFDTSAHTFTWTPGYDDSGTYAVTFNVSDGNLSDFETITISVGSVNRPPELASIGDKTAVEGSELKFTITATDPDLNDLGYSISTLPQGAEFDEDTLTFSWTPDYEQSGSHSITFTVSDGDLSDSETISVDVDNTNRAPVLDQIGNKNVDENTTLSFIVSAEDPDSNPLAYSATGVPDTADFDPVTRKFTWKPNYGESGTYSVTFNVSDGNLSDSETIVISVGLVNRAPELVPIGDKTVNEGSELEFVISATDPDPDALVYSTSALSDGADFDENNHTFTWTPDYGQEGSYYVTFTVSDGSLSDFETISIDVLNTNRAPVLSEIGDMNVSEGEELSFVINGSDPDGNPLSYSVSDAPGGAVFNANTRSFVWTPGYDASGAYEVTFTVSDGDLNDSETIIITVGSVNRPPVLAPIGNKVINENSELSFKVTGTDPDVDDLTYFIESKPINANFDDNTGQFRWTPDYNASGTYSVTFGVNDGSLNDSETVFITVNHVNRDPILDNIGNKQINEGEELTFNVSAHDDDGDSLIFYSTGVPRDANFDPETREFSWTPDFEDSGTYSVTFYVSDGYLVDSETVTISVGSVNRAPELVPIGDKTVDEGSELRFTVSGSDPDSNDIAYSAIGIPDGADFDEDTQEFVWDPDYDQSGTHNVTFSVSDGELSDSETISITVYHVNRPPELYPVGDLFVDENELLTVSLQANDKDEGDVLYYSVTDAPEGCIINSSTGAFTWTPSYEEAGIHNVLFSVSDGQTQDTENVKITVANINRPPQIDIPLQVYVAENSTLYLDLNASDPDNTPLEISTDFEFGSLQDGIFTWNTGYEDEGNYDVSFTVSDGELEVSQTIEIIVTGSNSAPVLYSISSVLFLVNELDTVTINLTAVDIDGDELIFSKNVSYGNISGNVFTWTPGSDDSGIYYILFTVSDGQLSDSKTAIIAVGNTNRPPSIVHTGTQIVKENDPLEFILNATDPDNNDTLSYTVSDLPNGALFDNSTGSFSWTPTYEQSGSYTVEFYASDMIYTAVDTVIINVENVNRAPLFETMPMCEVNETEQVCINLSASDPDGDSVSFSTEFDNGKIIGDTFVWDTGYYDSGEYNILFNATDGDLCDSTTVHVRVNPTNMPPEIESIGSHSVYENETLEFYVNATDADNDPLIYNASGKPSGSSFDPETRLFHWVPSYHQSGTYSVEFHVTDGELNDSEAITIRVYNVDNTKATDYSGFSSSDSSSGGGGGASSGAEDYNNVAYKDYSIKYVTQGSQIEFKFPNSENDLDTLSFTALKAAGHVKTVIEILHDRSSLVSTNPPGNVYRHINIWVGDTKFNSGNYFSSAEITFRVSKQWLEENNADQSSVRLYRYSGGSWNQLKTSRIGTDVNNYYFKAQTPGFSPFAIVSTGSSQALSNSVPESTAQSTQVTYESNAGLNSVSDVSTDAEIMTKALEQEPVSPFNTSIFLVGIVGILLIGSAIGYHSRNESPVLRRYYKAINAFVLGMGNAAEWTTHRLSSESMHKDYAALGVKLNEIRNADYKAIYEKKLAEIKERQKQ